MKSDNYTYINILQKNLADIFGVFSEVAQSKI